MNTQVLPPDDDLHRFEDADAALLSLLRMLERLGYDFVTTSPATHARVISRGSPREARTVRDVLGWNLPFLPDCLEPDLFQSLISAGAVERLTSGQLLSRVRVSTLGRRQFVHSPYPTTAEDAVFFGPDSYRFANLIADELARRPGRRGAHLVDIGAGAGVGAIVAAALGQNFRLTMTDVNPQALRLARINAAAASVDAAYVVGANLDAVEGAIDIAVANPPYIIDPAQRAYRDGGDMNGGEIALEMADMALQRLAPAGRLILYTGSAIVDGRDLLGEHLRSLAARRGCSFRYREIDPDVFGEELDQPAYHGVERIALVAAVIGRSPDDDEHQAHPAE